jgi:predicted neuraminidase
MRPAVIHYPPGPEYGDAWRMFQGIPTIERTRKGRLWAAWYGGGSTEDPFNYVPLVTSTDDGKTWSGPKMVIDLPDLGRAWDPCLWTDPDGSLWLFWTQSMGHWDGRGGVWFIVSRNPDAETPKWSAPVRIADGVMLNKPTVLSSGEWLFPIALWPMPHNLRMVNERHKLGLSSKAIEALSFDFGLDRGLSTVFVSTNRGKTFSRLGHAVVPDVNHNEHMLVERRDGSLWMLVRTMYGIGESISTDRGRTWTQGRPSGIPHPVTRFHIRRIASGNLLLVRNNPPAAGREAGRSRSHMTAYISKDDGKTLLGGLLLDERDGVSYPDATQAADGRIFVIYDHNRQTDREILMAAFREEDAREGKAVSSDVRLHVMVNKGSPD